MHKNCSERHKLLKVARTTKRQKVLKSCQAQSGQAYQGIQSRLNDELAEVVGGGGEGGEEGRGEGGAEKLNQKFVSL